MKLQIKSLDKDLYSDYRPLAYSTEGAAGLDLKAQEGVMLQPFETAVVHTALQIAVPKGYVGIIAPRSGLGSLGIILANTIGVIDSDYRGELLLSVWNRTHPDLGENLKICRGQRIAQLMIIPCPQFDIELVEDLDDTIRGKQGFGSTGRF